MSEIKPPEGYRFLRDDEEPEMGDMVYNVIGEVWSPLPEHILVLAQCFAIGKDIYRVTPARKIEE